MLTLGPLNLKTLFERLFQTLITQWSNLNLPPTKNMII